MKKTLILLLIGMIVFSMASMDSLAAKKSKKSAGSITQEDMTSMSETIDRLTRKVYANSLFSPADNASMIEIKISPCPQSKTGTNSYGYCSSRA